MSTVRNQRDGWLYVVVPHDVPPVRRAALVADLEAAGMRLATAKDPERVDGPVMVSLYVANKKLAAKLRTARKDRRG